MIQRARIRLISFILAACLMAASLPAIAAKVVSYGDRSIKRVAITVDDCWSVVQLKRVLSAADRYGVPVTFFPCGQAIRYNPAIWRKIASSRHEIGNHSYDHPSFTRLSQAGIERQLKLSQEALNKALGYKYRLTFLRPPYGNGGYAGRLYKPMLAAMNRLGYTHAIMWTVDDLKNASRVVSQTRNGGNILFHANSKSVDTLIRVIPMLQKKGYKLVTVSQLYGIGR